MVVRIEYDRVHRDEKQRVRQRSALEGIHPGGEVAPQANARKQNNGPVPAPAARGGLWRCEPGHELEQGLEAQTVRSFEEGGRVEISEEGK